MPGRNNGKARGVRDFDCASPRPAEVSPRRLHTSRRVEGSISVPLPLHNRPSKRMSLASIGVMLRWKLPILLLISLLGGAIGWAWQLGAAPVRYQAHVMLMSTEPGSVWVKSMQMPTWRQWHPEEAETPVSKSIESPLALLSSDRLAQIVWQQARQENLLPSHLSQADDLYTQGVLKVYSYRHHGVVRLVATDTRADVARRLAEIYWSAYENLVTELQTTWAAQQKDFLQSQYTALMTELQSVEQRIAQYVQIVGWRDASATASVQLATLAKVRHELHSAQGQLAEAQIESARLRQQLNAANRPMAELIAEADRPEALDNQHHTGDKPDATHIANLQAELRTLEVAQASALLQDDWSHADWIRRDEDIQRLKRDILDQQMVLVSYQPAIPKSPERPRVRGELVKTLALVESRLPALKHRVSRLQQQQKQLTQAVSSLPEQQHQMSLLEQDRQRKVALQVQLEQALAALQVQEAVFHPGLLLVDAPKHPRHPVTPAPWQTALWSAVGSFALGASVVIARRRMPVLPVTPEQAQFEHDVPVLGVIPWQSLAQWNNYRQKGVLEVLSDPVDQCQLQAYQDLALNLRAQRNASGRHVLTVAATRQSATHSVILANLGACLAQSGERVVLLDTNWRNPRLHDIFGQSLCPERGLTSLLQGDTASSPQGADVWATRLQDCPTPTGVQVNLTYINAGERLSDPFDALSAPALESLLADLSGMYDWVLLDAPPLLKSPDAGVLLGLSDGLLLLVEQRATDADLQDALQLVRHRESVCVGAVFREA